MIPIKDKYFEFYFYFRGFITILLWKLFPGPVEIAVRFRSRYLRESQESFWQIVNSRVRHVCLRSIGTFIKRCCEQETQPTAKASANACAPTGSRRKN